MVVVKASGEGAMTESASIELSITDDVATVITRGELDLHDGDELANALRVARESADTVVVDLQEATFIDSAILAKLLEATNALLKGGRRLRVLATEGSHPLYVLRTVGFEAIMDIVVGDAARG